MKISAHRIIRMLRAGVNVVSDNDSQGVDGRIVAYTDTNSQLAEQYRMLQTHLYSLKTEKKIKSLMITSSHEEDGKTITCCNLAATLACDKNKRVILIDCDIRKPSVHSMLNLKKSPGVSDILSGKCSASDFTKKPALGNLFVIPSGDEVEHPSEMLRGPATKAFLDTLTASFDYVLIDTPPTLPVSDSRIIGALCDAVLLVVRFDKTSKKSVKDSFFMLKVAHASPIACVLTDFRAPIYNYTRYSSYYYGQRARE